MKKKSKIVTKLLVAFVAAITTINLFFSYAAFASTAVDAHAHGVNHPEQNATNATIVEAGTVKLQKITKQITAIGSLRAAQGIIVRPEIAGRVTGVYFTSGQKVVAGAPLVQLNKNIVEAEFMQSKSALLLAKLNYGRMKALYKTRTISKADFDTASFGETTAEAKVAQYQAMLNQTLITAPFSGRLGLSLVSLGDYLDAGQEIVKLESIDPIEVEFNVPEVYLSQLFVGQNIKVISDVYRNKIFVGKIYAIDAAVNLNNRTLAMRATIPNTEGKLVSGSFVKVVIDLVPKSPSLIVPQIALFYDNGLAYVYKIVGNKAIKTKVVAGERDQENIEVLNGLNVGDKIVIAGQLNLDDGDAVQLAQQ